MIVINNRGNRNNDPTFNLLLSAAVNLEHRSEISQHRAGIEYEIASEKVPYRFMFARNLVPPVPQLEDQQHRPSTINARRQ